ncbi:TPA: 3-octaprenyl-4-hydroxybenzoate carboxy-lyase, partial [Vibrio vulnificus]|nr:3-octaprenyl-4-hydroxybenzoate carboxy-lyase [Vibrio vulnificus]
EVVESLWQVEYVKQSNKFIVVCDDDVKADDWHDIIWAITTRMDPSRDTLKIESSEGCCAKLIFDATNKYPEEITREWGKP